jgi:hypothetical protein
MIKSFDVGGRESLKSTRERDTNVGWGARPVVEFCVAQAIFFVCGSIGIWHRVLLETRFVFLS